MKTEREIARLSLEMREFKDEMRGFKEEAQRDRKEMNRKRGELANKMGSLVEDLVATLDKFTQFFPEYGDCRLIGVLASLYVDQNVIQYATKQKILIMGMDDEAMQVLNPEIVSKGVKG